MAAAQASAGTAPFFIPLTTPETVEIPDGLKLDQGDGTFVQIPSVDERTAPWKVPAGVSQTNLMSMEEVENAVEGSVVRVDAGNNSSMFDMLAYDPTGRYIFIPHETPFGAGVSRYDTETDLTEILFKGDESGADGDAGFNNNSDFGAFDPVRWTPNGTLIAGEEWSGTGRMVEICDPLGIAPPDPNAPALNEGNCETDPAADWRVLDGLPLSAQEGIVFSLNDPDDVFYWVDEDRSGSIYKTEFKDSGRYNAGTTYVLRANDYVATGGDPTQRWTACRTPPLSALVRQPGCRSPTQTARRYRVSKIRARICSMPTATSLTRGRRDAMPPTMSTARRTAVPRTRPSASRKTATR